MKVLHNVFLGVLIISILLMTCAIVEYGLEESREHYSFEEIIPTQVTYPDEDSRIFSFTLDEITAEKSYLVFMANHEEVKAMVDGNVYQDLKRNSVFGHTTGTTFHFIMIPTATRRISVRCDNVYKGIPQSDYQFYYGDGLHIMKYLLRQSLLASIFSLVDISLGIAMMIYWLMAKTKIYKKRALLSLGLFTLIMGFWTLNETTVFKLYVMDSVPGAFVAFTCLMLAVIPYVLFINEFFEIRKRTFATCIVMLASLNYLVCTTLQMLNIADFKQTVWTTHILIGVAVIYQGYAMVYTYKERGFDYRMRMNLLGTAFLASVVLFDILQYYRQVLLINEAGRISLLIYTLTLGLAAVKETNEMLDEARKAEVYRELAFMDTLTGLYNRNAYNDYLTKNNAKKNNMIISFDLNNLKKCNDTLGHKAGDRYITSAAHIIKKVFSDVGKCYRIGGDEFCVVVEDGREVAIEELLQAVKQEQEECNRRLQKAYVQIAMGYAVFDETQDRNLEDTRNRSDERMYRMKTEMKNEIKSEISI